MPSSDERKIVSGQAALAEPLRHRNVAARTWIEVVLHQIIPRDQRGVSTNEIDFSNAWLTRHCLVVAFKTVGFALRYSQNSLRLIVQLAPLATPRRDPLVSVVTLTALCDSTLCGITVQRFSIARLPRNQARSHETKPVP